MMKYSYFQINNKYRIQLWREGLTSYQSCKEFIYAGRDARAMLGMDKRIFRTARGSRILIYHGICLSDHTRFNPIFLTRKIFEQHLKFYKDYFNLVSLDQYYAGEFSEDQFNVCLSFDDGFANNFKYVLPLLEEYNVPAAFFITAIREAGYDILWNDFLGIVTRYGPEKLNYDNTEYHKDRFRRYAEPSGKTLTDRLKENGFEAKKEMMNRLRHLFPDDKLVEDYWMQMSEEEIKVLASSSWVTIGSHGYYHNRMDKLSIPQPLKKCRDRKIFLKR